MSSPREKFYLTTPIYYVNARPHIGHAYTTIVADVLARRHRLLGHDTFFLTGTDEHGQKIERSAAAAGIPPQQFADQVAAEFQKLWDRMGITYDKFIRTTAPEHSRGVQKLWRELEARGYIYLDSYTGSYCVSDEAFVDAPAGTPCPDCGRLLETVTEENYFFKLSEFQQPLLDLIESNKLKIENDARRNEVLSFVRGGLKDLSISRSSFKWGIPVPGNNKHVVYVWLDALANYMTAIGYGSDDLKDKAQFDKFWPADLHLVGKEIIRFHCVYWPAFLLAAGLPLPKAITAHGWLLFDNSKMSKSKGNIVRTETILDAFGTLCPPTSTDVTDRRGTASAVPNTTASEEGTSAAEVHPPSPNDRDLFAADILRYFLLREIPFGQDGSFSFEALVTRYNADLANGYGNLVSRTLSMLEKYCESEVPTGPPDQTLEELLAELENFTPKYDSNEIRSLMESLPSIVADFLDKNDFANGAKSIAMLVSTTDQMLTGLTPWKKDLQKKEEKKAVEQTLYVAAEAIRIITILLHPIMPYATARVWAMLGLDPEALTTNNQQRTTLTWGGLKPGTKLGPLSPIFPRADKGLIQIMTELENQQSTTNNQQPPTTSPAAPPRTTSLDEPSGALPVAGSHAHTTGPGPTPEPLATNHQPLNTESPQISIDDFAKIELRVAQIKIAERIPKADKLLRLEVDLGHGFPPRQILSGIAEWYSPEELIGRRIVVITNLAPRKMRGLESHGMLLAASEEGGKPYLATVPEGVPLGTRLK